MALIVFPVDYGLAPPVGSEAEPQPQNDFGAFMCNFMRFCACFTAWGAGFCDNKTQIQENITVIDESSYPPR